MLICYQTGKQKISNYVVITPVRNEERYIENTIKSMIMQTSRPLRWVIVDDGSTDNTARIISKYLKYNWITLVKRENRGYRKLGAGVVDAFYDGYDALNEREQQADIIVKLDGDLSFGAEYFEKILDVFCEDKKLGIASGQPYVQYDDSTRIERTNPDHARGPSKIYRAECFKEIGGLIRHLGWDTVDEISAQMKGWKTRCLSVVVYIHHRPTASSTGLWVNGKYREGYIAYYLGYHPIYLFFKCMRQVFEKPRVVGALFVFLGWLMSLLQFKERYNDKEFRKFLRKKQLLTIKNKVFM